MGKASEGKGFFNRCFRCICWCYCILVLLIVIVTTLTYYFFTNEVPEAPTYNFQSFNVKSLDFQDDSSLKTEFAANVLAKNPNTNVGFAYGEKSNVTLYYNYTMISSGKLPAFNQDPGNTTILEIALAGSSANVSSDSFQDDAKDSKDDQGIPLTVIVEVPMKIYVGKVDLANFYTWVTCDLVVDKLESGDTAKVLQSHCIPDVQF